MVLPTKKQPGQGTKRNNSPDLESSESESLVDLAPAKKAKVVHTKGSKALVRVLLYSLPECSVKATYIKRGNNLKELRKIFCEEVIQEHGTAQLKKTPSDAFYFEYTDPEHHNALTLLTASAFDAVVLLRPKPPVLTVKLKASAKASVEPPKAAPVKAAPATAPILPTAESSSDAGPLPLTVAEKVEVTVLFPDRENMEFILRRTSPVEKLYKILASELGICERSFKLLHEGSSVRSDDTPATLNWEDQVDLYLYRMQSGGKPVIYILPPQPLDSVKVQLDLVPQWQFSAVYPLNKIENTAEGKQRINWHVSASPDGILVNKTDSEEASYLYWEAKALVNVRPAAHLPFDPSCVDLSPENAVIMPFEQVVPHLHSALKALALDVEARTSFITYWLPELMHFEHKHVAFRFIPQIEYEQAAPLEIQPKPDCITRVFWVFDGINNEEALADKWDAARSRTETVNWAQVIGLDAKAFDQSVFRVLEWCVHLKLPSVS